MDVCRGGPAVAGPMHVIHVMSSKRHTPAPPFARSPLHTGTALNPFLYYYPPRQKTGGAIWISHVMCVVCTQQGGIKVPQSRLQHIYCVRGYCLCICVSEHACLLVPHLSDFWHTVLVCAAARH